MFLFSKKIMVKKTEEESIVSANAETAGTAVEVEKKSKQSLQYNAEGKPLINCLSNRRVVVRHIPKNTGLVQDPNHVLGGGMAEDAVRYFTVPVLRSGAYVDVLTNSEKVYLEYIMGLEVNALSIYNTKDNFWDNYLVRLTKQDNYLDLSNPSDYIKYKVLLANKAYIAPSITELQERRKATYQYVLIDEGEEEKQTSSKINATMESYVEYGKIKDDADTLRVIIETLDGRATAANTKIEFLQERIYKLIQGNPKLFLNVVKDEFLPTKVLLRRAVDAGLVSRRGDYYYLADTKAPLCGVNEEPTLSVACKYLSAPKNQEVKFALEAKLNG